MLLRLACQPAQYFQVNSLQFTSIIG